MLLLLHTQFNIMFCQICVLDAMGKVILFTFGIVLVWGWALWVYCIATSITGCTQATDKQHLCWMIVEQVALMMTLCHHYFGKRYCLDAVFTTGKKHCLWNHWQYQYCEHYMWEFASLVLTWMCSYWLVHQCSFSSFGIDGSHKKLMILKMKLKINA